MLPRSNTQLQRPLGSQDGPADGAVATAGDFPAWLGSCLLPSPLHSPERHKGAEGGTVALGQS